MIKLIQKPSNSEYRQEHQQREVNFSVATVDEEKQVAEEWFYKIRCRDYLCDILYSKKFGQPAQIYGFNFDYTQVKDDPEILNLVVYLGKNEQENFENNKSILEKIEKENDLTPTVILDTDIPNAFLFRADKFWKSAPHLISLYSWIIRLSTYKINDKEDWLEELCTISSSDEIYRLRYTKTKLKKMLTSLKTYPAVSPQKMEERLAQQDIRNWHNYSGIVSYLNPT